MKRQSLYIPMRDGVRLAVDVFFPQEVEKGNKVPTILNQTRYYRAWKLRFPINLFLPDSQYTGLRKRLLKNGYAWVSVDVRGTGASFGYVKVAFSKEQVEDAREIVDWIVRQPWSDGKVGGYGASYDGICAELLLVHSHPAVKAVMPLFSPYDLYEDITFPGGIFLAWFSKDWGDFNRALDRNALSEVKGLAERLVIKGVFPVDEDRDRSLLDQAISEHGKNWDIFGTLHRIVYRDDQIRAGEYLSFDDLSPHTRISTKSSAPVYSYSGWFDAAYPRAAIRRFLSAPHRGNRLILGPWDHGGFHNVSPSIRRKNRFNHMGEVLKFFNYHLKGIDGGITEEKPVKYYTMIEDRWKTSGTWPPPGVRMHSFYLAADNQLSLTKPNESDGSDLYRVDNFVGSGTKSRWRTLTLSVRGAKLYPDRRERDKKLLTYTSQPLDHDLEVTGHPLARLHICADAEDACIFVYLEDVDQKDRVTMVTEGQLRAMHHRIREDDTYNGTIPRRSFLKRDADTLAPGEITELVFDLIPTSYLFKKHHFIRIAIAGADQDHFTPIPGDPPLLTIYRNVRYPSCLELPVVNG